MAGKYVLTNDIDCQGQTITMLGSSSSPFTGILDGNGYAIKNYVMSGSEYLGLFHTITGTVQNLQLESFSLSTGINSDVYGNIYAGSITAINSGTIFNCSANGSVSARTRGATSNSRVGGITAQNNGLISCCFVNVVVSSRSSGTARAGGVACQNYGTIRECLSKSSVSATGNPSEYLGGIAQYSDGTIENCLFVGSLASGDAWTYRDSIAQSKGDNAVENKNYKYGTITGGTSASVSTLDNSTFYTSTLGWDSTYWNLSGLNFNNGILPTLKMTHHKIV